jgi:acetyl esterase/lipase
LTIGLKAIVLHQAISFAVACFPLRTLALAAGITLMDRDRSWPRLCAQLLLYEMLNDCYNRVAGKQSRTKKIGLAGPTFKLCIFQGKRNTDDVTIYASPARAKNLSGLSLTCIHVGSAKKLREKSVADASKLWECGVQAEMHVVRRFQPLNFQWRSSFSHGRILHLNT